MDEKFVEDQSKFPVIELWDSILVVPIVGVMDSSRTRELMETLLEETRETGARVVIIDLSGVAVMDTEVSKRLMDLGKAVQVMGAEYIVCGIQSDQVHSMVDLGIDLETIDTHHDLNSALNAGLEEVGLEVRETEVNPE